MEQIKEYFPKALLERYGESISEASAHAAAAVEDVVACLAALSPEQAAAPVAPGKWSPLQVADHLHRVNLLAIAGIERVSRGEEPVRTERGSVAADGGLVVDLASAEPAADPSLAQVTADLRSSNAALAEAAMAAQASGLGTAVVNVNPFFGELTPLDSVRMAALHARHHIKKHLAG